MGVHLTAHVSKAAERMVGVLAAPLLQSPLLIGDNQFAYCKEKGARDALAFLVLTCILAFERKRKVTLFCSYVQGAFDKVPEERFECKIRKAGLPAPLVPVYLSWMKKRRANVVTDGAQSSDMVLRDMAYQGTVWGPSLWNVFFGDAQTAVHKAGFKAIVYADDLNAIKEHDGKTNNDDALGDGRKCQVELHRWGHANGVTFDPSKESLHVLSRNDPADDPFKILGVLFDVKFIMADGIHSLAAEAGWRIRTILRTRRFHSTSELVHLYKSQVLSFLEYRTAAIYHACDTHLDHIDRLQRRFLREIDVTAEQAVNEYNLAPLSTKTDIAMLGMIHRAAMGRGPAQLHQFFLPTVDRSLFPTRARGRRHRRQLREYRTGHFSEMLARSALGLISVYNLLPQAVVDAASVRDLQACLQSMVKKQVSCRAEGWDLLFSPRGPLYNHPLLRFSH